MASGNRNIRHRQRDGDDGVKADVGDQQGKILKQMAQKPYFGPIGEHGGEGFGKLVSQTDGVSLRHAKMPSVPAPPARPAPDSAQQ